MDFIIYLSYAIVLIAAGLGATVLVCAAIGNAMEKNKKQEKSQSVLQKCGRSDIRLQK